MTTGEKVKIYLFKAAPEEDHDNQSVGLLTTGSQMEEHQTHEEGVTPPTTLTCGRVVRRQQDRFITLLNDSLEIDAELVPVLVFQYSTSLVHTLWRHLTQPSQHAGIIFTSQRCVQSVIEACRSFDGDREWEPVLRREWASKPIFCVGHSTLSKAKELFSPVCEDSLQTGRESHAESLAEKIIEVNANAVISLPLLYPCGVQRRDTLQKSLSDASIPVKQCIVYESVMNPVLPKLLAVVTDELKALRREEVLCFFSPSGVKHVFQHLARELLQSERVHVVAIGPTTKTALESFFADNQLNKIVHQCKDPTPEALLDVLESQLGYRKQSA